MIPEIQVWACTYYLHIEISWLRGVDWRKETYKGKTV